MDEEWGNFLFVISLKIWGLSVESENNFPQKSLQWNWNDWAINQLVNWQKINQKVFW